MQILEKIKRNSFIAIVIFFVPIISTSIGILKWFYDNKIDYLKIKHESEISKLIVIYEKKISALENTINNPRQHDINKNIYPQYIENLKNIIEQKKSCEVTNPIPDKNILWNKSDFQIEGIAKNIEFVWIVLSFYIEDKESYNLYKAEVDKNNKWKTIVKLDPPIRGYDRLYRISIFDDSIDNNHYFNPLILKKPNEKKELPFLKELMFDCYQTMEVKRVTD